MSILLLKGSMVRIAFYSHDTFGLGHLRRCLKLIQAIRCSIRDVEGLLITGSPWAHLFPCPPGFEFARLPPIVKRGPGYQPQDKGADLTEVLAFRERRLKATLRDFRPDLLVVDNVPCGLKGEMLDALRNLREESSTKCVLALRDVLDRPERVVQEWSAVGASEALESLYHEVWVFGDEKDLAEMVRLPGMSAARLRVCGRIGLGGELDREARGHKGALTRNTNRPQPRVLVSGGGGGDADSLVTTYVEMLRTRRPEITSRIVLGPDFPHTTSRELIANNGFKARIDPFVSDLPQAMRGVDLVVAMAGYNTTCEIETVGQRAVLVPRVWPREEQLLRARKQERSGRAEVLHPSDLTPESLWTSIRACLARPTPQRIDHTGAQNAALHAAVLLDQGLIAGQAGMETS